MTFERVLLLFGSALAIWCGLTVAEASYFRGLPAPDAHRAVLPGDGEGLTIRPSRYPPIRPGDWIARLDAPTVHLAATILEGSDEATLALGAGHIEGTALPGEIGNIGIAGHRDTTFRAVRNLALGDPLIVTAQDRVLEFQITSTTIVDPEDVYVLDATSSTTLTLVTCYPFSFIGHAPKRFIVKARLAAERPR